MNTGSKCREIKIFRWLAWALLGAVLVYIVCAVALTGDHSINGPFYNCGEVDEFSIATFRRDIEQEGGYQEASGTVVLEQGSFSYTLSVGKYSGGWNYLYVQIENLTAESFECKVTYENLKDNEVVESIEETYTLSEGMNLLPLPEQAFTRLRIRFSGEEGLSFVVSSVQLRENPPISNAGKAGWAAAITILCYVFVSGILRYFYQKRAQRGRVRPYACIELLQEAYLLILRRASELRERVPRLSRHNRLLRVILFGGLCCSCIDYHMDNPVFAVRYRYYVLICALIVIGIGILSVDKEPKKQNWNNPLVWGWLITGICMCISDFVRVNAVYQFSEYAILLAIGFFIFTWNNMENRGEILEDFVRALHVIFWIIAVYCILFRPDNAEVRYSGFVSNPNTFAIFLSIFWAVALGTLEYGIRAHKRNRELLFYIIEVCVIFSFIWKTQAATELVAVLLVGVVWLVRLCVYTSRNHIKKRLAATIVIALALFLPVHATLSLGLLYVPETLGTTVVYEDDLEIEKIFLGTEVYAADSASTVQSNRLIQKLSANSMAQALSGRNYIWKEYLRDLNLFGHENRPYMYIQGKRNFAHNGVLGTAYYFGIFTAVPYVVMLVAMLLRMWRFARKNIEYAAVPLLVCVAFLAELLAECVETPFSAFPWVVTYVLMGSVFCDEENEEPLPEEEKLPDHCENGESMA